MTNTHRGLFAVVLFTAVLAFGFSVYAAGQNDQGQNNKHGHEKAVCDKNQKTQGDDADCNAHVVTDEKGNPQVTNHAVTGYGPIQFQTAYGAITPASTIWQWNGKTVAIVDAYDDPRAES